MNKFTFRNDVLPLKNQLYRLALRITQNEADAEDIVQDTMLKVWNQRERWETIDSMEAFCMTVCRNLSLDHLRLMENRHDSLDDSPVERQDHHANPFEETVRRNQLEIIHQIIDSLPEKQRTCIQLRDIEGKSYKEIASVMGITEEQVKVNIFRARQTIRQQYEKLR